MTTPKYSDAIIENEINSQMLPLANVRIAYRQMKAFEAMSASLAEIAAYLNSPLRVAQPFDIAQDVSKSFAMTPELLVAMEDAAPGAMAAANPAMAEPIARAVAASRKRT